MSKRYESTFTYLFKMAGEASFSKSVKQALMTSSTLNGLYLDEVIIQFVWLQTFA